jgi:hypothetical protein
VDNRTQSAALNPLDLGIGGDTSFLGPPDASGTSVMLQPGNRSVWLNVTGFVEALPPPPTKAEAAAINESWAQLANGSLITNVQDVVSFRLRADDPLSASIGDVISVNLTDAYGVFAGSFTFKYVDKTPDLVYAVTVCKTVTCTGDNRLYDQNTGSLHASGNPNPIWVTDLMAPDYRFYLLMANAAKPMTINITHSPTMAASYALVFNKLGGASGDDPSGPLFTQPQSCPAVLTRCYFFQGGALTVSSVYTNYPAQDQILENGAYIVRQGGQVVFKVPPSMDVHVSTNANNSLGNTTTLTFVTLNLPSLDGLASSFASDGTVNVGTTTGTQKLVNGQASSFSLKVATAYPRLWEDFWRGIMPAALHESPAGTACTGGTGNFTIQEDAQGATLILCGLYNGDPAHEPDVVLVVRQATVRVTLS